VPDEPAVLANAIRGAMLERDIVGLADGLETMVGTRGIKLSGGQVQRAAVARMLVREAGLLVIDDVSSALDAKTEVELWQALRERGTTVLGSTSKRAALRAADRVVVLDAGRVVAVGPWSELAQDWDALAG